jgi:hypothetical protein
MMASHAGEEDRRYVSTRRNFACLAMDVSALGTSAAHLRQSLSETGSQPLAA